MSKLWIMLLMCAFFTSARADVRVGSKNFTEAYILGELVAQTLEDKARMPVERKFGLGGTGIVYQAIENRQIDMYVEYTGTLAEAILKDPGLKTHEALTGALRERNLVMSGSIGFNNTYALAVRREFAESHGIKTLSDLRKVLEEARFAFTYEFMSRADGFAALTKHYGLQLPRETVKAMEHSLIYEALKNGDVDVIEVYSTDGKISAMDLVVLEDDRKFFPRYDAVLVARREFVEENPEAWEIVTKAVEGSVSEDVMSRMNASVDLDRRSYASVISELSKKAVETRGPGLAARVWSRTKEHLALVGISLAACIAVGIPLGILAANYAPLGQVILVVASVLQTIPSLALLCFLIPLFGIGQSPALVALFLYGLLPIVLNTFTGLRSLDPSYGETARALGLTSGQRLRLIELPIVSPQILAGVKTSAIVTIGTATLAALIGAGGYGVPIVTGLAMNDNSTILIGAVPAAVMALLTHVLFEGVKRVFVPRYLRS